MSTFVQIHTLTGYSGVLLNRDDAGMSKRIIYGEKERIRISSQFIKRKLRLAEGPHSLSNLGSMGVRSRLIFRKKIAEPLIEEGYERDHVVAATLAVIESMFGKKKKEERGKNDKEKDAKNEVSDPLKVLERKETIIMGEKEIEYVKSKIRSALEDASSLSDAQSISKAMEDNLKDKGFNDNLRKMGAMSLDVAAFGRMSTGDALSNVDAAVHVAHAFTTDGLAPEIDYFTVVDELKDREGGEDGGAAHLGEAEISSPLLYGYYVVDFDQLIRNLHGLDHSREVAAQMVSSLIHLAATQVVGAKKGSTSPYSSADFVLVEVGNQMPRTLAEAFREPSKGSLKSAVEKVTDYVRSKDAMYGPQADERLIAAICDVHPGLGSYSSLPDICGRVSSYLRGE